MNKSNIDQYVPSVAFTSKTFYWIGLRKTDWVIYDGSQGIIFISYDLVLTLKT